jgi:hypothetical protein
LVINRIDTVHKHFNPDFAPCVVGEVDKWIFWIFNFLQFTIDGKNNSKTKVAKVFFFIFMSSYAEMSFFKNKKSSFLL